MASPKSLYDPMVVPLDISKEEAASIKVVGVNSAYKVDINTVAATVPLEISKEKAVPVKVTEVSSEYKIGVDTAIVIHGDYDYYHGATTVTPKANSQTILETADKVVLDDIKVLKIPYWETSNISGGYTVFIAGEV